MTSAQIESEDQPETKGITKSRNDGAARKKNLKVDGALFEKVDGAGTNFDTKSRRIWHFTKSRRRRLY